MISKKTMTELGLAIFALFLILVIFITLFIYIRCLYVGDGALLCSLMYGVCLAAVLIFCLVLVGTGLILMMGGVGILDVFCWPAFFFVLFLAFILAFVLEWYAPTTQRDKQT